MPGLKTDAIQLGISGTATNNLTLRSNVDGTFTFARGNVGATTQDILTITSGGEVALPANTSNKLAAASGSAPVYGVRAWAVFNGTTTGTNPPTAGGNVATVQRTSAGAYAVTFSIPMPSANYAISIISRNNPNATCAYSIFGTPTTSGFSFYTLTTTPALADSDFVSITVTC